MTDRLLPIETSPTRLEVVTWRADVGAQRSLIARDGFKSIPGETPLDLRAVADRVGSSLRMVKELSQVDRLRSPLRRCCSR